MAELVVAGDAGIALLQSSNSLVDFIGLDELLAGDALSKFFNIGEQAALLFYADSTIFGDDALLAAAEHVSLLIIVSSADLDLDRGLLLRWIERGRLAQHRGKSICVVEIGEPAVAFRLAAGDDVVELALLDVGDVFVATPCLDRSPRSSLA